MRFVLLTGLMFASTVCVALTATEKAAIVERIKPVGKVQIRDTAELQSTDAVQLTRAQAVYEKHCIICHKDGLAGAPRFQNQTDWQARLDGRKLEDLVSSAIKGLNAMPPKGTCSDCSEQDITNAIQFMLPNHE